MAFEQVLPRRLARWVAAEPDWDRVYAEQLPRVLNFFRYRLGDTAEVEDLTARTFEKAHGVVGGGIHRAYAAVRDTRVPSPGSVAVEDPAGT